MSYNIHIGPNIRKSPYFDATVADGVRSFSVYNHMYIPGNFGDPEGEYDRLLNGVAMWDVGAERQVEIWGKDAAALVDRLCSRDLSKMKVGQGRYVAICNHQGQLINDPVLLKLDEQRYWLSIADSDIQLWASAVAQAEGYDVLVHEPDVSPLAIQGPLAVDLAADLFGQWVRDLKYFWFKETELFGIPLVLCRSGWSKQGGFELFLTDGSRGRELWETIREAGQAYRIGPGAPNDAERVESGLISYGADCRLPDYPADPFELGLRHIVDLDGDTDFIGKAALRDIAARGPARRRTGFFIDGPPVSGNQHPLPVLMGDETVGYLSEMVRSPRLDRNIGVGLIATDVADDAFLTVNLGTEPDADHRAVTLSGLPFL